jgi:4-amino-4-deoxy-L-arabinose transferase-like glycosyltransferase
MLTLAACLLGTTRLSLGQSALLPGALAGLATGSKYTLAVVALPVLLALGLCFPRGRILWAWMAALAAMLLAFLAAVPYSLIDIPGFLNGLGYEAFHYASGHAGFAGDPGLPQLLYYLRHLLSEFGYGAAGLAVLGVVLFPRADWRRAAIVTIFPAGLMWLLCTQRVHFTRNALAIHPFVAMFAAFGLVALHDAIVRVAGRRRWAPKRVNVPVLAGMVLVIAIVPFWHLAAHLRDRTDSRNLARAWAAEHLPFDWTIVVPTELAFDRRGLEIRGRRLKVVDLRSARDADTLNALLRDVPSPAVIMVPRWGADRRSPGQQAADALNAVARPFRVIKTFGTNDVLVNYSPPAAWGNPAFAIAILKQGS